MRGTSKKRFSLSHRLALILAALAIVATVSSASAAAPIRLTIEPIGVTGSYFALTMTPGETRDLAIQLGNAGAEPVLARTYPADAYTIINGGFGAKLFGEPTSGPTRWVSYPVDTLDLEPGQAITRTFTLAVPPDTKRGEYLTSLVIQNASPIAGGTSNTGRVAFNQVIRQTIAVVITVPGPKEPALQFGTATHRTIADRSTVAIALKNTGNVRLKPAGELVLKDSIGEEVSRYPVTMDSVYAGTETFVEVPFAQRLNAGDYTASLSLTDPDVNFSASSGLLAFTVARAEVDLTPRPIGSVPQPAVVNQTAEVAGPSSSSPALLWTLIVGGVLGAALLGAGGMYVWFRRRERL